MDVTPRIRSDYQVIQNYKAGQLKVSGNVYTQTVLIEPTNLQVLAYDRFEALDTKLSIQNIDFLIVGTGEVQQFLPKDVKQHFREKDISVETMTTAAACRMYNTLIADGRRVAALLFL